MSGPNGESCWATVMSADGDEKVLDDVGSGLLQMSALVRDFTRDAGSYSAEVCSALIDNIRKSENRLKVARAQLRAAGAALETPTERDEEEDDEQEAEKAAYDELVGRAEWWRFLRDHPELADEGTRPTTTT